MPEHSAKLGIEKEILVAMNTDHRGICKFDDSADPDYMRISNRVRELVEDAQSKIERAQTGNTC